jgi:aldehyde dehydrogenase (NAD+)
MVALTLNGVDFPFLSSVLRSPIPLLLLIYLPAHFLEGGNDLGFNLVNHLDVDKVAFTGSTGVGRLLRTSTAGSGKKLSLELGGKSPFLVFEDADLDSAVEGVVNAIWFNQGQVCCAGSRLLVQECVFDSFLAKLKRRMDHLRVGDSLDKCSDIGAINSERQLETVQRYVKMAREEGATVYQSAAQKLPEGEGFYFPPTLIYDVQPASTVVVEEIFGPVVTLMSFRSPAEGIKLANNTAFGLASSVWSENVSTCLDMAFKVKAGVVWVNAHNLFDAAAGFGGYKESGFGRESGREGLLEYCKPKWQENVRRTFTDAEKTASWATTIPSTPLIPGQVSKLPENIRQPVNRTHKMYIGGRQCRPDAPYVRAVRSASRSCDV